MFKLTILCVLLAVLSPSLGTTLEELQELMDTVDTTIKADQHEAAIEIRNNLIPLQYEISAAQDYIIGNLTESAQPYWKELEQLETEAAANGQNISECVESGNAQLYTLNVTTVNPPLSIINSYYNRGNDIVLNSSQYAYTAVDRLIQVKYNVSQCLSDDCADALKTEVESFYTWALFVIYDAIDDAYQYVQVELPKLLEEVVIDADTYVKNYTSILDTIKACIDQ